MSVDPKSKADSSPAGKILATLTAIVEAYEEKRWTDCVAKVGEYITLRQNAGQPTVTVNGRQWPGDHIATTYNRYALLEISGQEATHWN